MKKISRALVALCLAVSMLLGGCGLIDIGGYFANFGNLFAGQSLTSFEDMHYTRPDMAHFQTVLDDSLAQAAQQTDVGQLVDSIYSFYEVYDDFATNYALANIYYSKDLTDTQWEAEYNYCLEHAATADAGLDSLYRALAKSPVREQLEAEAYFGADFFDAYEGDSLYDETFQGYLAQEADLQSQYYSICAEANSVEYYSEEFFEQYGSRLAQVYLELIALRQQMATHAGYESYPEFAYEFYYGRDFTCQQAETYLASIQQDLVPMYKTLNESDFWDDALLVASQKDALDYVKTAASAMGGVVQEAFQAMEEGKLYDIAYSPNKFDGSFEIYLNSYYTPYIFLSPTNSTYDKLAFAHEFGHFCSDYASLGSMAGVDVAEVLSQGMEYLSLCYVEDDKLEALKMADCLNIYVEQAAYAAFEQRVYSLSGEELTEENVRALYEAVMTNYGINVSGWDSRDYVCMPHFFVSPMYVISYVVSNDVALQLYMMEQEAAGTGLQCLVDNLTTQHSGIQAFTQEAGLTSPFAEGWLQDVVRTLEAILG